MFTTVVYSVHTEFVIERQFAMFKYKSLAGIEKLVCYVHVFALSGCIITRIHCIK